jgi:hypothetical protein
VHHTDAGSRYTSFAFTAHLLEADIDASVGTVGDALDNALMDSQIGLYKTELIGGKARGRACRRSSWPPPNTWNGSTPPGSTPPLGTPRPPNTKPPSTLKPTPSRWLKPTSEASIKPGRFTTRQRPWHFKLCKLSQARFQRGSGSQMWRAAAQRAARRNISVHRKLTLHK